MTLSVASNWTWGNARQALLFVCGGALLLLTWLILYYGIMAATEGWLAPWDTVPVAQRPPVGDWQRSLNDFFEHEPGATLPATVVLATSALLFVVRFARGRHRAILPLEFAALNLLFIVLDFVFVLAARLATALWLTPSSPLDVGYHITGPAILITICLLLTLFLFQSIGWSAKWWLRMNAAASVLLVGGLVVAILASCAVPFIAIQ